MDINKIQVKLDCVVDLSFFRGWLIRIFSVHKTNKMVKKVINSS